jgi:hypothetical protein
MAVTDTASRLVMNVLSEKKHVTAAEWLSSVPLHGRTVLQRLELLKCWLRLMLNKGML